MPAADEHQGCDRPARSINDRTDPPTILARTSVHLLKMRSRSIGSIRDARPRSDHRSRDPLSVMGVFRARRERGWPRNLSRMRILAVEDRADYDGSGGQQGRHLRSPGHGTSLDAWSGHHVPGRSPPSPRSNPPTRPALIGIGPRIRSGRPGRRRSSPPCSWGPRSSSSTSSTWISPRISRICTVGPSVTISGPPIRPVHRGPAARAGGRSGHLGPSCWPRPASRPRWRPACSSGRRGSRSGSSAFVVADRRDAPGGEPVEGRTTSRISSIAASTTAWPASSCWSSRVLLRLELPRLRRPVAARVKSAPAAHVTRLRRRPA